MQNIFERSKTEQKFIGIWVYDDTEDFFSGIVKHYTEELLFLQHYTRYGKPDGIVVQEIDNIERIEFEDDYSMFMEYLVKHSDLLDSEEDINIRIRDYENWRFELLDQQLGNEKRIVGLQVLNENYFNGIVKWIDEDTVTLQVLGNNGEDEGKALLRLDDILSIRINDLRNRKRLMGYHWRKSRQ